MSCFHWFYKEIPIILPFSVTYPVNTVFKLSKHPLDGSTEIFEYAVHMRIARSPRTTLETSSTLFARNPTAVYRWKLFEFKMADEERRKGEKKGTKSKGKPKFRWKKPANLLNIGNKEKGRRF